MIDLESSSRTVLDGRPIRVAEAVADKPFRTGIVKIVFTNCGNAHRTSDPAVSTAMQNQADHSATATIIDLDTDAPDNNTASTNQLLQRVAQLDQREAAIEQTQNELSTQAEELAARSTALDALADSLDDKKRSLESLEQKLHDRERKLATEQLRCVELQDTLEETRHKLETQKAAATENEHQLKEQNTALQRQLEQAQIEITKLSEQITKYEIESAKAKSGDESPKTGDVTSSADTADKQPVDNSRKPDEQLRKNSDTSTGKKKRRFEYIDDPDLPAEASAATEKFGRRLWPFGQS